MTYSTAPPSLPGGDNQIHPQIEDVVELLEIWRNPLTATAAMLKFQDLLEHMQDQFYGGTRIILCFPSGSGMSWAISQVPGLQEVVLDVPNSLQHEYTPVHAHVFTTNVDFQTVVNWSGIIQDYTKTLIVSSTIPVVNTVTDKITYTYLDSTTQTGLYWIDASIAPFTFPWYTTTLLA